MKNYSNIIAPGGGVWSKKAAYQICRNPEFVDNPSLLAAFLRDYLLQNKYVLLPFHNIYGGNVSETLKAITKLIDSGENIEMIDVVKQPVKHVLCGIKGQNISDIHSVYSHPQALLQCDEKIKKHNIVPISAGGTGVMIGQIGLGEGLLLDEETALKNGYEIYDDDFGPSDNLTYFVVLSCKTDKKSKHILNNDDVQVGILEVDDTPGSLLLQLFPTLFSGVDLKQITAVNHTDSKGHIGIVSSVLALQRSNAFIHNIGLFSGNISQKIDSVLAQDHQIQIQEGNIEISNKPGSLFHLLMYLKYYNINLQSLDSKVDGDKVRFDISGLAHKLPETSVLEEKNPEVAAHIKEFILGNIEKIQKITTL